MTFEYPTEIENLVLQARATPSRLKARSFLIQATKVAASWRSSAPVEAAILSSQLYSELAREENTPQLRTSRWNSGLTSLVIADPTTDYRLADAYAQISVDFFQDTYCD